MTEPANRFYATGRRKEAVARVFLAPGAGQITINKRPIDEYFPRESLVQRVNQPLDLVGAAGKFDIRVTVRGGGVAGQAGAVRHGIARALERYDENLRQSLKQAGCLTRDARQKERKKYGQRGARARFQFSKR